MSPCLGRITLLCTQSLMMPPLQLLSVRLHLQLTCPHWVCVLDLPLQPHLCSWLICWESIFLSLYCWQASTSGKHVLIQANLNSSLCQQTYSFKLTTLFYYLILPQSVHQKPIRLHYLLPGHHSLCYLLVYSKEKVEKKCASVLTSSESQAMQEGKGM